MENKINKALKILNEKYYNFDNLNLSDYNKIMNKKFGDLNVTRGYGYELPASMNTWVLSDEDMELLSERIALYKDDVNIYADFCSMCNIYESEIQKLGAGYFEDLIFEDDKIVGLEECAFNDSYKEYLNIL